MIESSNRLITELSNDGMVESSNHRIVESPFDYSTEQSNHHVMVSCMVWLNYRLFDLLNSRMVVGLWSNRALRMGLRALSKDECSLAS